MRPRLIVMDGPHADKVFHLDGCIKKVIGRGPLNDIDLPDLQISQHHCRIEADAENINLVDLGSTNGTFVNGDQIEHAVKLRNGDEIQIGETKLIFRNEESSEETS